MKSERRHELKQNTLAANLFNLPEIGKKYGSRIALGVILLALLVVWIRYRMNASEERLNSAHRSLNAAALDLQHLKSQDIAPPGEELNVAQQRQIWYADAISRADDAIKYSGDQDPQLKAQALLSKGDVNFDLANLPDLPGAATQPSLQTQPDKTELLSQAEEAYKQILLDYPQLSFEAMAAHFGLAAVAENRAAAEGKDSAQWNEANLQYQAVIDDQNAPAPYKQYALYRQKLLSQLKQPAMIGVLPTTAASSMGPAVPATQPVAK